MNPVVVLAAVVALVVALAPKKAGAATRTAGERYQADEGGSPAPVAPSTPRPISSSRANTFAEYAQAGASIVDSINKVVGAFKSSEYDPDFEFTNE